MRKTTKFCTCCLRPARAEAKECVCGFRFSPTPSLATYHRARKNKPKGPDETTFRINMNMKRYIHL